MSNAVAAAEAGWWLASDGNWYPPERRAVPAAPPDGRPAGGRRPMAVVQQSTSSTANHDVFSAFGSLTSSAPTLTLLPPPTAVVVGPAAGSTGPRDDQPGDTATFEAPARRLLPRRSITLAGLGSRVTAYLLDAVTCLVCLWACVTLAAFVGLRGLAMLAVAGGSAWPSCAGTRCGTSPFPARRRSWASCTSGWPSGSPASTP